MANFLNENQVKVLEAKEWVVKPNGCYVILYSKDYSETDWSDICKVIGCSVESTEVKILTFGYTNK